MDNVDLHEIAELAFIGHTEHQKPCGCESIIDEVVKDFNNDHKFWAAYPESTFLRGIMIRAMEKYAKRVYIRIRDWERR